MRHGKYIPVTSGSWTSWTQKTTSSVKFWTHPVSLAPPPTTPPPYKVSFSWKACKFPLKWQTSRKFLATWSRVLMNTGVFQHGTPVIIQVFACCDELDVVLHRHWRVSQKLSKFLLNYRPGCSTYEPRSQHLDLLYWCHRKIISSVNCLQMSGFHTFRTIKQFTQKLWSA